MPSSRRKPTSSVVTLLLLLCLVPSAQAFTSPSPASSSLLHQHTLEMTANDINGKSIAASIREELANKLASLPPNISSRPGLAVMLVGSRTDSQTYVRMKQKACGDCGMDSFLAEYKNGDEVEEETLLEKIREWNTDTKVNGILVQLPLPKHINEERILREIDPSKVGSFCCNTVLPALQMRISAFHLLIVCIFLGWLNNQTKIGCRWLTSSKHSQTILHIHTCRSHTTKLERFHINPISYPLHSPGMY